MTQAVLTRDIAYCKLTEVSDAMRRDFYEKMYPARAQWLAEHWRWWYRADFQPEIGPIAAVTEDAMVGTLGAIPFSFAFEGDKQAGVWCLDLGVLTTARSSRLGLHLVKMARTVFPHVIAHGNERTFRLTTKHSGWKPKEDVFRCALPLNPGKIYGRSDSGLQRTGSVFATPMYRGLLKTWFLHAPKLEPSELPKTAMELAALLGEDTRGALSILRDAGWLQWRLYDCPIPSSHLLFTCDGAVAVVTDLVSKNVRRLHILLLGGSMERKAIKALLYGIARWAMNNGIDVLWMITSNPAVIEDCRYLLPMHLQSLMIAHSQDSRIETALCGKCGPVYSIDSDFDLLIPRDPKKADG